MPNLLLANETGSCLCEAIAISENWASFILQSPQGLMTGSANGYVAGQIYYDAIMVRVSGFSALNIYSFILMFP